MGYNEVRNTVKEQELSLINRERLSLTGVEDVAGFDENAVLLRTTLGELCIRGSGLHVERIDLDAGQLEIRGSVQELCYAGQNSDASWWRRLFG